MICAKVARYHERYHHPDRLGFPLRRKGAKGSGEFERIGWDDALDEIAANLLRVEREHGAEAVWPYFYAGTMGLVQRDGIERLTHVKKYSRFKSTICVMLSDTGFKAGPRPALGRACDRDRPAFRPGRGLGHQPGPHPRQHDDPHRPRP